ncbi:MAG: hypothetical protein R3C97_11865 [Geminicoccaceae bacterium]
MERAHIASARVAVPAERAFAYLRSIDAFRHWSLGCLETVERGDGIWQGRSLFDGSATFCRLEVDESRLTIDFHVAGSPESLRPRISARVIGGEVLDEDHHSCLITLVAYRSAGMNDERWQQLRATHECEIRLIRAQLEKGGDGWPSVAFDDRA